MRFFEGLLGAAVNLETSSENPAAWRCCMRASMHADGTNSHPRCNLVETAVLDGTGETVAGPHTVGTDAKTMAETETMGEISMIWLI